MNQFIKIRNLVAGVHTLSWVGVTSVFQTLISKIRTIQPQRIIDDCFKKIVH